MRAASLLIWAGLWSSACADIPLTPADFVGVDVDGDGHDRFNAQGQIVDCDDFNAAIHPGATDSCDGLDNDCDGVLDEEGEYFYLDADGDGYGRPDDIRRECAAPPGYVTDATDCDDEDPNRSPGTPEQCDGTDNNCNNVYDDVDVESAEFILFLDSDGDGWGDPEVPVGSCSGVAPPGIDAVEDGSDCHDDDAAAFPGSVAFEVAGDGIDQNCDGVDACVDLNCDGRHDVVVGWADDGLLPWVDADPGADSQLLTILQSDGASGASEALTIGDNVSTADVLATDLNGDGYTDLVQAVHQDSGGALVEASLVHYGPVAGERPAGVEAPGDPLSLSVTGAQRLATGDFDGDGVPDLVVGAAETAPGVGGTAVFLGVGDHAGGGPEVEPDHLLPTDQVHSLLVVDVDADGFDDLLICQGPEASAVEGVEDADLFLYSGSADGLQVDSATAVTTGCIEMAAGELDGEPGPEVVVVRGYTLTDGPRQLRPQLFSARGGEWIATAIFSGVSARSVQLVDVDGDADLDILFGGGPRISGSAEAPSLSWDTEVQVFVNDDGTLPDEATVALPTEGGLYPVVGYFNDDPHLDMVAPGMTPNPTGVAGTVIYYGTGDDDLFDPSAGASRTPGEWIYGTAVDQNGDGLTDILAVGANDTGGLIMLVGSSEIPLGSKVELVDGPASLRAPLVVP